MTTQQKIQQLERLLVEEENLKGLGKTHPIFKTWKIQVQRVFIKVFGESSHELKSFNDLNFYYDIGVFSSSGNFQTMRENDQYVKDLDSAIRIIKQFIKDFKDDLECEKPIENIDIKIDNKKVFIVHGHDDNARLELVNILKNELNLEPIVLQEEATVSIEIIISKFERLANDCSSALILFTPDDNADGKLRARQNVILELGYFLGKFQNKENRRIAIIKNGEVEIPSDISGVLYFEFHKNIKEIFFDLKRQFETWGIK